MNLYFTEKALKGCVVETANSFFSSLLSTAKVSDVTDLFEEHIADGAVAWLPVGGRENNLATINLGSDPAAGLIERVTNAIDAVLEREWVEKGQPTGATSPRGAVEEWFQIEDGRLENVGNLRDQKVRDLIGRVVVTLHDSESGSRPTVDIRDHGIGLKAEQFASTILSLNENRKLRKFFLAGAFGQGGSTALAYSLYTTVVSRAMDVNGNGANPVAGTIVRFNKGDLRTDKHGVYEYAVDLSTGQPFIFDVPEEEFPPGTLVRHIAMDLGKYTRVLTAPTGSLWYLAHHYLFDPVLPYRIEERRSKNETANRTVGGNHRLLTRGENTEHQLSAERSFRDGSVKITWWVLSQEGEAAADRITQYCLRSKPIIITYNGQKQGELPNTIVKNDLKLPYLERYLIVHVDCDRVDNESRRQLFPTTRETLRDTSLLDELRTLVTETLQGDEKLALLDQQRKQKYIERVDTQSVENIRRRLANRIKAIAFTGGGGSGPSVDPPGPVSPPVQRVPIPVQDPPTMLEILGPDPKNVYPGRRFNLRFKTDADPSYFNSPDFFIAVIRPVKFGQFTGTTSVLDGYGTAYFTVGEELGVGETAEITLEIRPRGATSVRDSVNLEVVEPPASAGTGSGNTASPNIIPQWVSRNDPYWQLNDWDEDTVAEVQQTEDEVRIFVSAENKKLNQVLARAQRRSVAVVENLKDFYLEHVSFHALLADLDRQRLADAEDTKASEDSELSERLVGRELQRACETVCGIISENFDFLTVASQVQDGDEG